MSLSPYKSQPDYAFWSRAVTALPFDAVDPVVSAPFRITPLERVATAGSCFAQHISRHLRGAGFNFFVAETPHPIASPELAETYNYGVFSARYGNIYTSRQLLQLFCRAYSEFSPQEGPWQNADGRIVDPFRPQIQPGGFLNIEEFEVDRRQHLARVRQTFAELDVFIFTLGLTECWASRSDGAVFPICPGVAGGTFDDGQYAFINLGVDEVVADMVKFIDKLRAVNQNARIILTVSPVPLVATAEDRHVLVSTTYSKSVLRVAAEMICRNRPGVAYFPSYEIITGNFSRGRYFASDCRNVTESGVSHVMGLFLKHFTEGGVPQEKFTSPDVDKSEDFIKEMESVVQTICDEVLLDEHGA